MSGECQLERCLCSAILLTRSQPSLTPFIRVLKSRANLWNFVNVSLEPVCMLHEKTQLEKTGQNFPLLPQVIGCADKKLAHATQADSHL